MPNQEWTETTPASIDTDFDKLWKTFLNNCKVEDITLPQTTDKIIEAMKNAIMHFENRTRVSVQMDYIEETLNIDGKPLNNDEYLIIAHYLRYIFLLNEQTYVQHLWQPFQKDIGLKNLATQIASIKDTIKLEEQTIERLIFNAEEDFL